MNILMRVHCMPMFINKCIKQLGKQILVLRLYTEAVRQCSYQTFRLQYNIYIQNLSIHNYHLILSERSRLIKTYLRQKHIF